jgi:phage I-like protein
MKFDMKFDSNFLKAVGSKGIELTEEQVNRIKAGVATEDYISFNRDESTLVICANKLESRATKDWVELVPKGKFGTRDDRGPFEIQNMPRLLDSIARNRMPIAGDYEHKTFDFVMADGKASGWITELREGKDFVEGFVTHTPRALDLIQQAEYAYLSPVFIRGDQNEEGFYDVDMLIGYGLTNNPALYLPSILAEAFSAQHGRKAIKLQSFGGSLVNNEDSKPDYLEAYTASVADCTALTEENEALKAEVFALKAKERQDAFDVRIKKLSLTPKIKASLENAFKENKTEVLEGMFSVLEARPVQAHKEPVQLKAIEFEDPEEELQEPSNLKFLMRGIPADRIKAVK